MLESDIGGFVIHPILAADAGTHTNLQLFGAGGFGALMGWYARSGWR